MKKIVYYFIILISFITYFFASYNFDKLNQFENILYVSFLEDKPNEYFIKNTLEQNKNIRDIVAISNGGFVDVLEKQYNRSINSKLLKVFGNPEKIFTKDDILYKDYFEKNGIYVSNSLAYSIFKNENVIGNKIFIDNKEYIICGVFKDKIPTIIIENNKDDTFDNIKVFFDKTESIVMNININSFIRVNNSEKIYINNINTKINLLHFTLQIPKILILVLTVYLFYKIFNFDNRFSIRNIFYQLFGVASIIILYFILNIDIKLLSSFTPNKWSDFDYYKNIFVNLSNNLKNYAQIDKTLIFININGDIFIILFNIFINMVGIIYCFKKIKNKEKI